MCYDMLGEEPFLVCYDLRTLELAGPAAEGGNEPKACSRPQPWAWVLCLVLDIQPA